MNINKAQLKKLIEAVIREAEDLAKPPTPEPEETPLPPDPDPEVIKYSRELEQKLKAMKGTKIELYVKHGVRKGKQEFRALLRKMAQDARQKDFEVIMGQVKKGDKVVDIAASKNLIPATGGEVDPEDAKAANVAAYKASGMNVKGGDVGGKEEPQKVSGMSGAQLLKKVRELPDENAKLDFVDSLDPDDRKRLMRKMTGYKGAEEERLQLQRQGEKRGDWERWEREEAEERRKNAAERKKIEAELQAKWGLPDEKFALLDPLKYLPDKYWTDKEWDRYTQGGEVQTATAGAGTKHAGKDVYRPSFSAKKVDPALLKKLAIGTLREAKKRRK